MNILLLTDKLATGGAENYFLQLENGLSHDKLTFFSAAAGGEMIDKVKHKSRFSLLSRKSHLQNLFKIRKMLVNNHIELIHANSLRMVLYTVALRMMLWRPLKVIYTKHNVTVLERKQPKLFARLVNKFVQQIITVSDFEKNNLIHLGVAPAAIQTIYNGIDLYRFTKKSNRNEHIKKIGILARLSEEKNHQLFLQIALKMKDDPNVIFYIAGDGPEYEKIQAFIKTHQLTHKVNMLGNVNDPEEFIKEMDILLITSNREVFPMVMLESMAVGTPVVTINRGGINEAIIHRETGLLIDNHSVDDFHEKLTYLLSHDDVREQMIHKARRKVEVEFSAEKMVSQTIELYTHIARPIKNFKKMSKTGECYERNKKTTSLRHHSSSSKVTTVGN